LAFTPHRPGGEVPSSRVRVAYRERAGCLRVQHAGIRVRPASRDVDGSLRFSFGTWTSDSCYRIFSACPQLVRFLRRIWSESPVWTGRETFSTTLTARPGRTDNRQCVRITGLEPAIRVHRDPSAGVPVSRSPLTGTPVVGLHPPPPGWRGFAVVCASSASRRAGCLRVQRAERRVVPASRDDGGSLRFSFGTCTSYSFYRVFSACPQLVRFLRRIWSESPVWTGRETFSTTLTARPGRTDNRQCVRITGLEPAIRGHRDPSAAVPVSRSPLTGTPVVGLHPPPPGW
jgi:hypothetical protein